MRRLVALFVVAIVGAGLFGVSGISSGVGVNGDRVSGSSLRVELAAISSTPVLQCYLSALSSANYGPGAGGSTVAASAAASWTNLRVEGLAIEQYVHTTLHYQPNAADLALATSSLEGELTQSALANKFTCPGTSAQAIAAMPAEMRGAELQDQAASLYLVSKLNSSIPLTLLSMKTYYVAHALSYDTICVAIALVSPSNVAAFSKAQASGMSVAQLAKKFSLDHSASKGGAYGCYDPSSTSYASVRGAIGATAIDAFPTTPRTVTLSGATYALYVSPISRATTPFVKAEGQVLSDIRNLNATSASTMRQQILYRAAVGVDPAYGRWGLAQSGPMVFAPALPATQDVVPAALSGAAAIYK